MARKFKTLRRYNDPGHAHALTFSCFRGQTFLSKDRTRRWFCEAVTRACEKHRFVVWAYVVMPEHVHLLVCPSEREYDAGAFCGSLKLSVSRKAVAWVRANTPDFLPRMRDAQPNGKFTHRFWQRGGGHDRNLFRTRTVHQQIEYIHLNPVRRGLCERAEDRHWSSAADYAAGDAGRARGDAPLPVDLETVPDFAE